jgi:hypothetical protein
LDWRLESLIDHITTGRPPRDREIDAVFANVEELMDTLFHEIG